jgi:licheninase
MKLAILFTLAVSLVSLNIFAEPAYSAHQWRLVWGDEFQGEGTLDSQKWIYEVGNVGSANHEAQTYTDRSDNSFLENGALVIQAKKEDFGDKHYTSARLHSQQSWLYGRFEFSAKLPTGRGTWPAIWFMPDQQVYGDQLWPDNGEIDLLEAVGFDQNVNHFSVHTKDYNWMTHSNPTFWTSVPDGNLQFHKYTLDWYQDHLDFWLDEVKYMTLEKTGDWRQWPFDQKFYLIINLAIGGGWGGLHGIDDFLFPARFEIDSVHVYELVDQFPRKIK